MTGKFLINFSIFKNFKFTIILFLLLANTLWCWPEEELHSTTAIPKEGVQATFSQNLSKRTVTAIKKWQEGSETNLHIQYRLNQIKQEPIAKAALLTSIEKNKTKKDNE